MNAIHSITTKKLHFVSALVHQPVYATHPVLDIAVLDRLPNGPNRVAYA
jgi:hypothetical protein